jgi:RNA polymerase sigma-70 factor (ECF subfamily)
VVECLREFRRFFVLPVSADILVRLYLWRRLLDSEPNEEVLWRQRASKGDPVALGQIYDAYALRIFRYLFRRLGSTSLAEDLTADVFLRVVEASGTPRFCRGSLAPWLYRLAHNRLVDHFRQHGESPLPEDFDLADSGRDDLHVHRHELRLAVRKLTPDQQQVVVLKFIEGLSNSEIAIVMDKPEGAIKSLQHRALDTLRRLLEADLQS